jgi:alpha-galactosidase
MQSLQLGVKEEHVRRTVIMLGLLAAVGPCFAAAPSVTAGRQSYSLSFPLRPGLAWKNLTAGVRVDGRWLNLSDFRSCQFASGVLRCAGNPPVKTFELRFKEAPGRTYLTVQASVQVSAACRVQEFRLLQSAAPLPLPEPRAGWTLLADGFNALEIGTLVSLEKLAKPVRGAWVSSVQSAARNETFAFAALSGTAWPTWFEWTPSGALSIRAGGETGGESIRVAAAGAVASDPVLIGFWNNRLPQDVLTLVAGEIVRQRPRTAAARRPDPGWCSWMYYPRVAEADVLLAAQTMATRLADAGYKMIQIDGGWWNKRGDWEPNERFPHGIRWISDEVHKRGLRFGIHMSPFRIDADSRLAKQHPDWMLRALDGSGLAAERAGAREPRYILDASHPDARRWLGETFARMARDWNVDYFKLDFLELGAREGIRHDPSSTGIAAFRSAMRVIRESVPANIVILGCNLPTLAGYEYVDAARVGPDINKVGKGHTGPNGEYANMVWGGETQSLTAQARAEARQFYTHGRLFVNDADAVLVTPDYTLEEARAHMTLVALTGGSLFLGDRLDTLPADRLALLKHPGVLDIWRESRHAMPLDLFSGEETPRIWKLVRPSGNIVLGVFNWSDAEVRIRIPFTIAGIPQVERQKVRDIWSCEPVTVSGDALVLSQGGHSVRLLEFSAPGR